MISKNIEQKIFVNKLNKSINENFDNQKLSNNTILEKSPDHKNNELFDRNLKDKILKVSNLKIVSDELERSQLNTKKKFIKEREIFSQLREDQNPQLQPNNIKLKFKLTNIFGIEKIEYTEKQTLLDVPSHWIKLNNIQTGQIYQAAYGEITVEDILNLIDSLNSDPESTLKDQSWLAPNEVLIMTSSDIAETCKVEDYFNSVRSYISNNFNKKDIPKLNFQTWMTNQQSEFFILSIFENIVNIFEHQLNLNHINISHIDIFDLQQKQIRDGEFNTWPRNSDVVVHEYIMKNFSKNIIFAMCDSESSPMIHSSITKLINSFHK